MRFLVSGVFWLFSSFFVVAEGNLDLLNSMDRGREWGAVGRLSLDNGNGFCTATLISEDVVLTAGHCVYDKNTGVLANLTSFEFQASWRNGRAENYRGIREIAVHSQYQFAKEASIDRIQFDVALLRLETPIRNPNVTPMLLAQLPKVGSDIGVVSYAKGRMEAPSVQSRCVAAAQQNNVLVMTCDVDFGASGSPVFATTNAGVGIVSVVSAMADMDGRPVSLGAFVNPVVTDLLAKLSPTDELRSDMGRRRNTGAKFQRP